MATHSSVLAWRIPGTAEPGRLPSMGLHRVGHDQRDLAAAAAVRHNSGNCFSAFDAFKLKQFSFKFQRARGFISSCSG